MLALREAGSAVNLGVIAAQQSAAAAQSQGVINMGNGYGQRLPIPDSTTVTISSNNGGGAGTKTCYIFNSGTYNTNPTNNDSGANSIVTTYDDGFSGNQINRLLQVGNGGYGLQLWGLTMQFTNYTSGSAYQAALTGSSPAINYFKGNNGAYVPYNINVATALRNTQFISGMVTLKFDGSVWVNGMSQFSASVLANTIAVFTFIWNPAMV